MELKARNIDLTEGIVWKRLIKFALPIFLGTLFQAFYSIVDAVIIGRYAGAGALASIDSVHTLINIPVNFFIGLSSGATIIISQYYGGKKFDKLASASHNGILFGFLGGLIFSLLGILLVPRITGLLKVPGEILPDAQVYLRIFYMGLSLSMLYNMGAGILRALGNSRTPFYYLVYANILNIILDLIFIAGMKMGVRGAALATIISQALSAVLILNNLLKTKLPCKIYWSSLRFHKVHLLEIFRLGLPVGFQATLFPISNTLVQTSINTFGVNSIAAWAICGKLDFLVWYISEAFAVAVSTFVAQNYGASKKERIRKGVRTGLIMNILILALVSFFLYLGSDFLPKLLVKDRQVIEIAGSIIRFLAPMYLFYSFCEILPGAIKGTGETLRPMIITLVTVCGSRIFWVLFIVPLRPSLFMVLCCYPMSWILSSIAFSIYYLFNINKFLEKAM